MTPSQKFEIQRVKDDIKNLIKLKETVQYGFLRKSIPIQIKQQKMLLKQLKSNTIKNIIENK